MIAFDTKKRCKAFGAYTGCPCSVTLDRGIDSTDKNQTRKDFIKEVDKLITNWASSCEKYVAGPTVGSRISENWNRALKLPYGRRSSVTCIYDESAPGGGSYCKLSLKEEVSIDQDELDLNILED